MHNAKQNPRHYAVTCAFASRRNPKRWAHLTIERIAPCTSLGKHFCAEGLCNTPGGIEASRTGIRSSSWSVGWPAPFELSEPPFVPPSARVAFQFRKPRVLAMYLHADYEYRCAALRPGCSSDSCLHPRVRVPIPERLDDSVVRQSPHRHQGAKTHRCELPTPHATRQLQACDVCNSAQQAVR